MTGETPRVGILHAPGAAAGLRDIVTAARGVCEPVVIYRPEVAEQNPALVSMSRAVVRTEVLPKKWRDADVAALGLAGCTTFHDNELEASDTVQRLFGLPGAPATATPWDKLSQRAAFGQGGVSALRSCAVDSIDDLRRAVDEIGLPAVLKPRRGMASAGVAFLSDATAVEKEASRRTSWRGLICEQLIPRGSHPSGASWLADYVSVETVSDGSTHHHVAVFDKLPLSVSYRPGSPREHAVRETGDVFPSRLPAAILRSVGALVTRALDALDVRYRVSHTELRVDSSGVEIIEVNGRLGGEVPRLLGLVRGPDMVRAAFTVALGGEPTLDETPDGGHVAAVYVPFPDRSGVVRSQVSRAVLRGTPGVVGVDEIARKGDLRSATGYRTANLSLRAPDAAGIERAVGALLDELSTAFADDGLLDDPWLCELRKHTS